MQVHGNGNGSVVQHTAEVVWLLQRSTQHALAVQLRCSNTDRMQQATGFTLLFSGCDERFPPRTWKPIVGLPCLAMIFSC